ncbi:MAG TPA: hypothetical protein VL346_05635 [Acidobacteriaceae bacterium]|nr:hypothetical protein [Acidobacteriaceae bacterium]
MTEINEASGELTPELTPRPRISGALQFATAEYAHLPETETCVACGQQLGGSYYQAGDQRLCNRCAERVFETFPRDTQARLTRALLAGAGAALVSLVIYAGFTIATHIYIGYLALGVGWLVGKAIIKASGGVGGRRYQIAAVVLTYLAIAMAEIPVILYNILHDPKIHIGAGFHFARIIPQLLWYGATSPFQQLRQLSQGLIGLFILFIGLRIAWQMTAQRGPSIQGPLSAA